MSNEILLNRIRLTLFDATATRYDRQIMPALGPLAQQLLDVAAPQPDDRVLDLGVATGTIALPAARLAAQVIGMDYAPTMLPFAGQNARQTNTPNIHFYQGDMHRLPHPANTFTLALSSFSFNGVKPRCVFPEVQRVLQPDGRLVFQEWGDVDEASTMVKQTIKANRVEKAVGRLANFRRLGQTPRAWDELGNAENIARFLRNVGFGEVKILRTQAAVPLTPLTFFQFRTAWAPYQAELGAMPADIRAQVEAGIMAQLTTWAKADGRFIWKPELLQMIAWK
ncbi:MAG: class I SAM-dependent methyltransferase [Anaerolineae bacterium]|nr:class I SAM-dependent methyltransferase [Anaerolineae bacterium]